MDSAAWDERYEAAELVWSAGPNQFVEAFARSLQPGRAIDLAAGEGRNAVWLAEQGWDVSAVDFSPVAMEKCRQMAAERGVTVATETADLTTYAPPPGDFDLVLVIYFHVPHDEMQTVMERAVAAVAPGGRLLLVGHDRTNIEHGYGGPQEPSILATPDEIVAMLDDLVVERAEVVEREVAVDAGHRPRGDDDGRVVALDTYVAAHRSAS